MKIAQKCLILATLDQGQGQCRPSTYGFLLFFFTKLLAPGNKAFCTGNDYVEQ